MDFSSYISPIVTTCFDNDLVTCNQDFSEMLQGNGCGEFSCIMAYSGGESVKEKTGLEIRKVVFVEGGPSFFIKKHWQPIQGASFTSEGVVEFAEYLAFRSDGLATPMPVACGEKRDGDLLVSFLITQDFFPLVDLEGLVLLQPELFRGAANLSKRRKVLAAIGSYARQMHDAGCNQKDFNATHVLLGDLALDVPKVALFDLQRVDRNVWQRFRWPVKALGELLFTLPEDQFDAEDHLFLFQTYIGQAKLSLLQRLLFRWVLAKRDRIARHSRKRNLAPKMG